MRNILSEPTPTELHGRLKFTVEQFVECQDVEGKDILDIGCGYGFFELWAARNGVRHITGIDMTDADLQTASRHVRFPNVVFRQGSAIEVPLETASCDTVVSWEVIEHIPKNTEPIMFHEVSRVLRPKGVFYLSTPNRTLRAILGDPTYWMINHRHYSLDFFEKLAGQAGFRVVKHAVKAGYGEILDAWNLYVSKWIFRRDRFLKAKSQALTDCDYARERGFNTLFVKFQKIQDGSGA
ncbi:MAG: methyltransferase domain-containing protein [Verrucomicrobia subdivision 3 bacterium]|nr:methyltransferase domain-containing protein [Limisphaerales bacterium]